MKLKEASEVFPIIKKIEPIFPDDCSVNCDRMWGTVTVGMVLGQSQEMTIEMLDSINDSALLKFLPNDWYRKIHEALAASEVAWRVKLERSRSV